MVIDNCALCGVYGPLLKSHIIPKFTVDWLKKTSATGYLRQAIAPNIRKQDAPKQRLLCENCEGIFSKYEKQFAEKIWVPYQDNNAESFYYDEWLRLFAISLAWRTVTLAINNLHQNNPKLAEAASEALSWWKAYLLNESSNPGPYEHHMLFVNNITVPIDERHMMPDKALHYLRRGYDSTIVNNNVHLLAYTKLPGIIFCSPIRPSQVSGWKGTRISRKGVITTEQVMGNEKFGYFLSTRIKIVAEAAISKKQQDQINKSLEADPIKAVNSESFQTFLLEQEFKVSN